MVAMSLSFPWKVSQGYNSWVMEMSPKSHFIFHEPLIFNRSRKTHGFFMGHEFKNPHENPINYETMKNSFSIHGLLMIMKKPWKKHGRLHFISWHFPGFFFCLLEFFHGQWTVEYKRDFNAFFMRFSCHIHGIFSWKTHENSPLKSPKKPI